MDRFKRLEQVGEGSFGKVYRSRSIDLKKDVAIKRIPIDKDNGIPFTAMREIKILKKFSYPYLVKGYDVMYEEGYVFMIMEYMEFDLTGLLNIKYKFTREHINSLIYQLLKGLSYLHSHGLIHRDIKASNILLNRQGHLKLVDFGLTREYASTMTNRVCTLWYRAPELLLGDTKYTDKVDSWSVGCIMLEMGLGCTPFKGSNETSQVKIIFDKLGVPKESYPWKDLFNTKKHEKKETHEEIITNLYGDNFDEDQLCLIRELLCLESANRISAKYALKLKVVNDQDGVFVPIEAEDVHEFKVKEKTQKLP
ncbi:putative cell division protein kinase [Nosema granulosis]|uniref:Cell division protein kinase n=1 Tax=Nosema granulosis TaxID=83296 RepID=A0A9P6KY09_9MICR|nr:putative cell division protein kinase [Nosema granulosis]